MGRACVVLSAFAVVGNVAGGGMLGTSLQRAGLSLPGLWILHGLSLQAFVTAVLSSKPVLCALPQALSIMSLNPEGRQKVCLAGGAVPLIRCARDCVVRANKSEGLLWQA